MNENGVLIIADVCFSNMAALEKVKTNVGNRWDEDEGDFYFLIDVFLEMLETLYNVEYERISSCTGIFKIWK